MNPLIKELFNFAVVTVPLKLFKTLSI